MTRNFILYLFLGLGLAAGLVSAHARFSAEARNRRVEIVVDYADAQALANTTSKAMDEVLSGLHHAGPDGSTGVTSVAVTEDTVATLYGNGIITSYDRDGNTTLVGFAPGFAVKMERVRDQLQHKAPGLAVTPAGPLLLRVNAPWSQFNGVPVGLDEDAVATIRRNNLLVVPRLQNFTGADEKSIYWDLQQAEKQCAPGGMGPVIFSGAAVLGNRGQIKATASALRDLRMTYGTVEMAKTFGDDDLSRMADDCTVRVHSIGTDEMGTMDEPTAIERFVRAAKERNIRVCYVRLFVNGLVDNPDVISANNEFVYKIVRGLEEAHLSLGSAHPYSQDPTPGRLLRILMAWGVIAGALLLLNRLAGPPDKLHLTLLILGIAAATVLAIPNEFVKGREILALLAACCFPAIGLCAPIKHGRCTHSQKEALSAATAHYVAITLWTVAGVVLIVGLLSGRLFLLKVDEFLGVKLVLVTPVLLTAAYYWLGLAELPAESPWRERRLQMASATARIFSQPLLVGQLLLGTVVLVVLALFVARSGNDPGVSVSPLELHVRALLDKYLLVRPRTKEFLIGHPALFLGLAAAASGRYTRWIVPLLIVGSIGQSSLLDTFCHLHTPLYLSMLRATIGWVLGALVGLLIFLAAGRITRKPAVSVLPQADGEAS